MNVMTLKGISSREKLTFKMIKYLLILNRMGKTRLQKYYISIKDTEILKSKIHSLVCHKELQSHTNIIDLNSDGTLLVFKRYAGLYFIMCIDSSDDKLLHLESIHFLVEVLDSFFRNVCELDLVFNFYRVYSIICLLYTSPSPRD